MRERGGGRERYKDREMGRERKRGGQSNRQIDVQMTYVKPYRHF